MLLPCPALTVDLVGLVDGNESVFIDLIYGVDDLGILVHRERDHKHSSGLARVSARNVDDGGAAVDIPRNLLVDLIALFADNAGDKGAGASEKEYGDKPLSEELESIAEGRSFYAYRVGENKLSPLRDGGSHYVSCAMPIISEGDIVGIVAALAQSDTDKAPEAVEQKLIQTAASFLGRQMES